MDITVNTTKVRKWIVRHKNVLAVVVIAVAINNKERNRIKSMSNFISVHGLYEDYDRFSK